MASVDAPIRRLLKPVLKAVFGDRSYLWFQVFGKMQDIRLRLVEEDEMELLPQLISPQDQVIDIGANYAYYTERMARLCPRGEVFAFEPIASTHWVCRKIVSLLGLRNVRLFQKGVGAKTESMTFEVPLQKIGVPSAGQAHMGGRNNNLAGAERYYAFSENVKVQCEVVALDDTAWFSQFKNLTFVKIDIEGAEIFALRGMEKLVRLHKPTILIEVVPFFLKGFGVKESELARLIADLGYLSFTYEKKERLLRRHDGPYIDRNYILLHQDKTANLSRLLSKD